MDRKIRIGTRESRLALAQTTLVIRRIQELYPRVSFEIIPMKTQGDLLIDRPLDALGGKGLFTGELNRALREGRLDLVVHSLKDLPMELEEGLEIRAYPPREDPRDVLVLPPPPPPEPPEGVSSPPEGGSSEAPGMPAPVGFSGLRRKLQFAGLYPHWETAPIRGNVPTRLDKLDRGDYGALVLAAAGLKRLGLDRRISRFFDPVQMIPAAGQGTLAVLTRRGTDLDFLGALEDPESRGCALAERAFVRALGGSCNDPIAAYARIQGGTLTLRGLYAAGENPRAVRGSLSGPPEDAEALGEALARRLLDRYRKAGSLFRGKGRVALVGAGPGDGGLLTLKGERLLREADMVLYDKLVGRGVLSRIPPETETLYVGKEAGRHTLPQEEINRLLVQAAAEGKRVVRLKGGDPFLFGRGGEEIEGLREAGIPFEVVSGVSSAFAVPASFGIPVTHRDYCSSVHIITGHNREDGGSEIPYEALVKAGGTLIFLMGVGSLEPICRGLMAAGMDGNTPAAILEAGTTARQRGVLSVLSRLPEEAEKAEVRSPAITVVGKVCALADTFSWMEAKPLGGVRIGITRPRNRAPRFRDMLAREGAEVVEIPSIETVPLDHTPDLEEALAALAAKAGKGWLVFTSPAGVEVFFDKLRAVGRDIRSLGGIKFAAIGKTTASVLEDRGILVDLVPGEYSGRALGKALAAAMEPGDAALLPRSRIGSAEVIRPLVEAGIPYRDLPLYDTLPLAARLEGTLREILLEGLDWVAFTSASTVEGLAAAAGKGGLEGRRALCIGAQTAAAAEKYRMKIYTAQEATLESMVEKLKEEVLKNGGAL
jgi:uroporphyrinogen III methyltransferase/synthase